MSVVDIVAVWQHALYFLLCLACLLESDIADMDCRCRALIAEIKLHSAVRIAVRSHIKDMSVCLLVCRELYSRIVQIAYISLIRCRYARNHRARLVGIGVIGQFIFHPFAHRQICLYHLHTVI